MREFKWKPVLTKLQARSARTLAAGRTAGPDKGSGEGFISADRWILYIGERGCMQIIQLSLSGMSTFLYILWDLLLTF